MGLLLALRQPQFLVGLGSDFARTRNFGSGPFRDLGDDRPVIAFTSLARKDPRVLVQSRRDQSPNLLPSAIKRPQQSEQGDSIVPIPFRRDAFRNSHEYRRIDALF